jgi:GT2 family glycosyltransferase
MKVDIVIPTFNHAELLREALASLVAQTHTDWQAYVVNNFSTDDTVDVIDSFGDPRLTRIDFANNGVIGAARNVGINAGSAPYVAFLDSDDVWYPDKLTVSLAALERGADLVCHAERWVETNGSTRVVRYGTKGRHRYSALLYRGNALSTSAVVMRRTLLTTTGGFDERPEIVTAEDYDLWLRAAETGARLVFLSDALGEFRRRSGSESSRITRHIAAERAVLTKHFRNRSGLAHLVRQRRRMALVDYGAARSYQRDGEMLKAWQSLLRCLVTFPLILRPYAALVLLLRDSALRTRVRRHGE